jgi:hypothetical protein
MGTKLTGKKVTHTYERDETITVCDECDQPITKMHITVEIDTTYQCPNGADSADYIHQLDFCSELCVGRYYKEAPEVRQNDKPTDELKGGE